VSDVSEDLDARIAAFLRTVCGAMGLELDVVIEPTPDNVRFDLRGEGGELLLRRRGEGLEALQHLVQTAFRRELGTTHHVVVDCQGYRKARDAELRQMAKFLVEKTKASGVPQEIGPLNPYARRVVHLAVAEDPDVTSESIGDAFLKTVIISRRKA
jgi:spoIIIJ-associated protein